MAADMTELSSLHSFGQRPKLDASLSSLDTTAHMMLSSYDFETQFKQESSAFYYVSPAADSLIDHAANDQSAAVESSDSLLHSISDKSTYSSPSAQASKVGGPLANLIQEDYIIKSEPVNKLQDDKIKQKDDPLSTVE